MLLIENVQTGQRRWFANLGMEIIMKKLLCLAALGGAALLAASAAFPSVSRADTFNFTSCHISNATDTGLACPPAGTSFGTVTLTGSGTVFNVDVTLSNGNLFVETGAGAGELFLFNALQGATVSNLTATFNTTDVTATLGGLTYTFHAPPGVHADGTGDLTGSIECTNPDNCNGASGTQPINDLHFTVTGMTLAQLETANADGNLFVADIICGAAQTGCVGLTGLVDVSVPIPGPIVGAGLPGLLMACLALWGLQRRRRGNNATA